MNNKIMIIKVRNYSTDRESTKDSCMKIIKFLDHSLSQDTMNYYYPRINKILENLYFLTNKKKFKQKINKKDEIDELETLISGYEDGTCLYRLQNNTANFFFAIVYQDKGKKVLYVGEAPIQIKKGDSKLKIYYHIYLKFSSDSSPLIIENFEKLQVIEDKDLSNYMLCCENPDLVKQFRYLVEMKKKQLNIDYLAEVSSCNDEDEYDDEESDYENFENENEVNDIDSECQNEENLFKQNDEDSKREFELSKENYKISCSNFQRDYARIIHAKAFRRLVDKAQIFTSSKGDHYRTRMTHTMEVVQIAKGIAKELDLNIELTEAIAIAHDIGHTPFGHQGERTLNDILLGRTDGIRVRHDEENFYGGFKHNLQGVKVVTLLEEKYFQYEGLNLSYQVLEGILKHTKFLCCRGCNEQNCRGERGECPHIEKELDRFLPDEFNKEQLFLGYNFATTLEGQVVAIADEIAQRSHDIDDALRSNLISFEELTDYLNLEKFESLNVILKKLKKDFDELNETTFFLHDNDVLHGRVISDIIAFFIKKLCSQSKKHIEHYKQNDFFAAYKRVDKKLICFDDNTSKLCSYLEDVVSKKVLTCSEVACFDNKANMIVQGLFKAYYDHPLLLPPNVLKSIYRQTVKKYNNAINFTVSDHSVVNKEIQQIINIKADASGKDEYFEKQKILVRAIVDYIAGMTDNYAVNEYNRIYRP